MRKLVYNANVFDGHCAKLKEKHCIIIEDNLVKEITEKQPELEYFDEVIDAGGRVVIPGLTDAHAHPGYPGAHNSLAQMRMDELKAVVDAAKDFGTYVFSHVYSDEAVRRNVEAGVMCIEHGQMMGDETARMMADKGVWLDPCPQFRIRDDFMMNRGGTPPTDMKALRKRTKIYVDKVARAEMRQDELIDKYKIPIVYGTDLTGSDDITDHVENGVRQLGALHAYKVRYGSLEGLRAATGNVYEMTKMCTYRNPYPDGKIGVLEEGSYADLCIVDGNPVEDLDVLCDPANMRLVMKDGTVYKNTL